MNRFANSPLPVSVAFVVPALVLILALGFSVPLAAVQPDPYERPDETYISISGTVDSVAPDSFMLDYGDGLVRVEMDDEGYLKIRKGDRVKVVGRMDNDLFEGRRLKADAVVKLYGS